MFTIPVPAWDARQVLPPNDDSNPIGAFRAPYPVSIVDFVWRFGTSWQRCKILSGLLEFRAEIHAYGAIAGFQWLDGSFAENIEALELRAPKDIDCVTFLKDLGGVADGMPELLGDHDVVHEFRHVDHYWVEMSKLDPEFLVAESAYWYSMWSHRRNKTWKGFVQIDLSPAHDQVARNLLDQIWGGLASPTAPGVTETGGGQP